MSYEELLDCYTNFDSSGILSLDPIYEEGERGTRMIFMVVATKIHFGDYRNLMSLLRQFKQRLTSPFWRVMYYRQKVALFQSQRQERYYSKILETEFDSDELTRCFYDFVQYHREPEKTLSIVERLESLHYDDPFLSSFVLHTVLYSKMIRQKQYISYLPDSSWTLRTNLDIALAKKDFIEMNNLLQKLDQFPNMRTPRYHFLCMILKGLIERKNLMKEVIELGQQVFESLEVSEEERKVLTNSYVLARCQNYLLGTKVPQMRKDMLEVLLQFVDVSSLTSEELDNFNLNARIIRGEFIVSVDSETRSEICFNNYRCLLEQKRYREAEELYSLKGEFMFEKMKGTMNISLLMFFRLAHLYATHRIQSIQDIENTFPIETNFKLFSPQMFARLEQTKQIVTHLTQIILSRGFTISYDNDRKECRSKLMNDSEEEICPVCLDEIEGDKITLIECPTCKKYVGHLSCVGNWLQTHDKCPYCNSKN